MILSGPEICELVERTRKAREARSQLKEEEVSDLELPLPLLDIEPFDPDRAGPNSYDVTLGPVLLVYRRTCQIVTHPDGSKYLDEFLDPEKPNETEEIKIPVDGYILRPGELYLGSTIERTKTGGLVPWLDGRSSIGRLGLTIHVTAGRGDDGFGVGVPGGCSWTLEMTATKAVKIKAGMRIGQLSFFKLSGKRAPYSGRYAVQQDKPVACRLWRK